MPWLTARVCMHTVSSVPPPVGVRFALLDARRTDGVRVTMPNAVFLDVGSPKFHNYAYLPRHNAGTRYGGGDSMLGFAMKPRQNATLKLTAVCSATHGHVNGTCKVKVLSVITTDC